MIRAFLTGAVLALMLEVGVDWVMPLDGRLRPDGRTVATRQSPSQLRSLGPDGRVSTIATSSQRGATRHIAMRSNATQGEY